MVYFIDKEKITFDDVLLVPQYSDILSRTEVSLKTMLGRMEMEIPIIVSPMDTVCGPDMMLLLKEMGGLAVLHRYLSIDEQVRLIKSIIPGPLAAAVGATGDFLERATALVDAGVEALCVDVAHGHNFSVGKAVERLKSNFPNVHIMAGNVATASGYKFLSDSGADSVRVGIGPSSVCSTRVQTGHGVPQLSALIEIAGNKRKETSIIADGGIRSAGDIVKALAVGADCVMMGSYFAGTFETPGGIIDVDGMTYKKFRGMASKEAQEDFRGQAKSLEGVASLVLYKGERARDKINDLLTNIRSGLSYTGARSIGDLQENAIFQKVSQSSHREGTPYILG